MPSERDQHSEIPSEINSDSLQDKVATVPFVFFISFYFYFCSFDFIITYIKKQIKKKIKKISLLDIANFLQV